jgi:hypothetical protein
MSDVEDELPTIVNKGFNYNEYSKLDGSNDRFLRKQENTNQLKQFFLKKIDEEPKVKEIKEDSIYELPF